MSWQKNRGTTMKRIDDINKERKLVIGINS